MWGASSPCLDYPRPHQRHRQTSTPALQSAHPLSFRSPPHHSRLHRRRTNLQALLPNLRPSREHLTPPRLRRRITRALDSRPLQNQMGLTIQSHNYHKSLGTDGTTCASPCQKTFRDTRHIPYSVLPNSYSILNSITATCPHTLMLWSVSSPSPPAPTSSHYHLSSKTPSPAP